MKIILPTLFLSVSAICVAPVSFAQTADDSTQTRQSRQGSQQGGMGAPREEAYTACADLAAQDVCGFETQRGAIEGLCQVSERDERLRCVREGAERRRGEGRGERARGDRARGNGQGGQGDQDSQE